MGNMRKMKISKVYGPQNNSYKDEVKGIATSFRCKTVNTVIGNAFLY